MNRFLNPSNYVRKVRQCWLDFRYDMRAMHEAEVRKFAAAGFDLERATGELNEHLAALGLPAYDHCAGMASVHWLLFACIKQQRTVRRVLEIGAYDGQTTALLARLFPTSEIVTVDLPRSDPILARTYGFARGGAERMAAYEALLSQNTKSPNVRLLRANSFFLPAAVSGKFDLVWIDGGHLYPEIAWDICNCYHLGADHSIIMIDDVIPDARGLRDGYVSPDSHAVLHYVTCRTKDPVELFLKREATEWSADPRRRKYVAVWEKRPEPPAVTGEPAN